MPSCNLIFPVVYVVTMQTAAPTDVLCFSKLPFHKQHMVGFTVWLES